MHQKINSPDIKAYACVFRPVKSPMRTLYKHIYSRICLIRHLKGIRKATNYANRWNSIIEARILDLVTRIHIAFICSKIQFLDVVVVYVMVAY